MKDLQYTIYTTTIVSLISYILTVKLIPIIKLKTLEAGLFGKDLNKGEKGLKTKM
jgi:hypothetical protein